MSGPAANETVTPGANIEVLVSNLSLTHLVATIGSLAMVDRQVRAVGADGIELTHVEPAVNIMTRQILREADLTEDDRRHPVRPPEAMLGYGLDAERPRNNSSLIQKLVRAQHATFSSERPPLNLLGRILPTQLLFPRRSQSFNYMRWTQVVTDKLPGVMYTSYTDIPPGEVRYTDEEAPFAPRLFQPKKSDWEQMGLREDSSADAIKTAMDERGLDGVALDIFQILEFDNPDALVDKLLEAGLVDEVHLSLNRTDLIGLSKWRSEASRRTRAAARAFADSPESAAETDEGRLLTKVLRKWHENPEIRRRIVVESGPWSLINRKRRLGRTVLNTRGLISRTHAA